MTKNLDSGPDLAYLTQIQIFKKIWLCQSVDIIVNIRKKLMIKSWEKLVMDGQMDRRTRGIS